MEKLRYSDEELQEFKQLILEKLNAAQAEFDALRESIANSSNRSLKGLEDGAFVYNREAMAAHCERQRKYIINLQNALLRIQNGVYGVCRKTGKLIPKERLRAVPHATLCIEAKQ